MRPATLLSAAVAMMIGASAANADTGFADSLAYWNQQGQSGSQIATLGVGAAHVTVESMIRGAGLKGNTGGNSLNSTGWNGEATDYVEFGFTVDSGFAAKLDKLYLGTKASGTGPQTVSVFTSLDNYGAAIASFGEDGSNFVDSAIDLSAFGDITGTLTFRLFGAGATGGAGTLRVADYYANNTYYYDTITGNVAAVPEPESYAMIIAGLGLMGFVVRRRSKL